MGIHRVIIGVPSLNNHPVSFEFIAYNTNKGAHASPNMH